MSMTNFFLASGLHFLFFHCYFCLAGSGLHEASKPLKAMVLLPERRFARTSVEEGASWKSTMVFLEEHQQAERAHEKIADKKL